MELVPHFLDEDQTSYKLSFELNLLLKIQVCNFALQHCAQYNHEDVSLKDILIEKINQKPFELLGY